MAYKFTKGDLKVGDLVYEDDTGRNTKIDFSEDQIDLVVNGQVALRVNTSNVSASVGLVGDGSALTGISGGGGGGDGSYSTLSVSGDTEFTGAVKAPYALTHDVVADGSISENDIVVVSGYSGTKLKVAKAQPDALTHCRGPFYVADQNANDGDTFSVVTSKVVAGVDTSDAANVGDKVWLGTTAGSVTLTMPGHTADDAQFSLQIEVGRVISVNASTGAYVLQPPQTNSPLIGRVQSGGGSSTLVRGFGSDYVGASCAASFQGEAQSDDDQIKFVAVMNASGKLQITMDNPTTNEIFTYWIWV